MIAPLALIAQLGVAATAATANAPGPEPAPAQWVHESWTVRDGLPVNSIKDIIQDRAGYIWAATFDGLVRFDGMRFTVYNSANSDELPSNRIVSLVEARDGALWLTTEQGHVVRFRDGQFTNIAFDGGKPGAGLVNLHQDSAGVVWVGTPEGLWTLQRDRLVRVGRGTLETRVVTVLPRRDGTLLVGTSRAGARAASIRSPVVSRSSGRATIPRTSTPSMKTALARCGSAPASIEVSLAAFRRR